jgi:hypothetical protein
MKLLPEETNINIDVYGYSCIDDCHVYYARVEGCGWTWTPETCTFW